MSAGESLCDHVYQGPLLPPARWPWEVRFSRAEIGEMLLLVGRGPHHSLFGLRRPLDGRDREGGMNDAIREITLNGERYYHADDVEVWHRDLVGSAERADALEEENATLREALARMTEEAFA